MNYNLYTCKHHAKKEYETEYTYTAYDYKHGDEILKTEQVPVKISFISSYAGVAHYGVYDPRTREEYRIETMYRAETYEGGHWNPSAYPDAETFERLYNYRLDHVWKNCGEKLPQDVFETFQKISERPLVNGLPY